MESPDQARASADDQTALGVRLAALRAAAGYTQETFAPQVHYGRSSIAIIVTGRQTAPRDFWIRCDLLLATGGLLAAEYDRQTASRRQHEVTLIKAANAEKQPDPDSRQLPETHGPFAVPRTADDGRPDTRGVTQAAHTVEDSLRGLREQLNTSLGATSIADVTISHWSTIADEYGRTYRTAPPALFLPALAHDLDELRTLTDRRLPTAQRRSLCHSTARLAGLLATTLVNLNQHREARSWFHTAELAAHESEDIPIQGWLLVRHAVSALYWGDSSRALEHSTRALQLTHQIPCVATAWAPAVQARALARHPGKAELVNGALARAAVAYQKLEALASEQDAYGYTSAQLHFYRSNALTGIGATTAAYEAQRAALHAYPDGAYLDPALVRLDQATCLLRDDEPEEAARLAASVLTDLPGDHRSPIVVEAIRHFGHAIGQPHHTLTAVQELLAAIPDPQPGTSPA